MSFHCLLISSSKQHIRSIAKPYLVCVVNDFAIIEDDIFSCHLLGCLGKQFLQHYSADDSSDWKTSVHSWVKGVKFDIPVADKVISMAQFNFNISISCNSIPSSCTPFASLSINQTIDTVPSDAALSHDLISKLFVNGLKSSQRIALNLWARTKLDSINFYAVKLQFVAVRCSDLNWSSIFALSSDGSQILLEDLHIKASLEKPNCQHKATNTGSSNQNLGALVVQFVLDRVVSVWLRMLDLSVGFGIRGRSSYYCSTPQHSLTAGGALNILMDCTL